MSIKNKLATSLNRRDEEPNIALAVEIGEKNDKAAIKELIELLKGRDKNFQSDSIKVLYELGELKPALVTSYADVFLELLKSKNNRLVWGSMAVLDAIATVEKKVIYNNLPQILDAADKGSVITNDRAINILTKLGAEKEYADDIQVLLLERLQKAHENQFAIYAEKTFSILSNKHQPPFREILSSRLRDTETESKRKRIKKLLNKLK